MTTTHSVNLSEHEVRAALDNRLGLVVRPVKNLGPVEFEGIKVTSFDRVHFSSFHSTWGPGTWIFETTLNKDVTGFESVSKGLQCPLGVPGDRLIGKETWKLVPASAYAASTDDGINQIPHRVSPGGYGWAIYREGWSRSRPGAWASPATMPAWASRITLGVEEVRCCRLYQLCEDDMRKAYGISMATPASYELYKQLCTSFEATWNRRYGKSYPWDSNPWVWAAKVKRVEA